MSRTTQLARCPYCLEVPTHVEFSLGERGKDTTYAVTCTNPYCEAQGSSHPTQEEAIAAWQNGTVFESIFFRYLDRLSDPVDGDPLEKIVDELLDALGELNKNGGDDSTTKH